MSRRAFCVSFKVSWFTNPFTDCVRQILLYTHSLWKRLVENTFISQTPRREVVVVWKLLLQCHNKITFIIKSLTAPTTLITTTSESFGNRVHFDMKLLLILTLATAVQGQDEVRETLFFPKFPAVIQLIPNASWQLKGFLCALTQLTNRAMRRQRHRDQCSIRKWDAWRVKTKSKKNAMSSRGWFAQTNPAIRPSRPDELAIRVRRPIRSRSARKWSVVRRKRTPRSNSNVRKDGYSLKRDVGSTRRPATNLALVPSQKRFAIRNRYACRSDRYKTVESCARNGSSSSGRRLTVHVVEGVSLSLQGKTWPNDKFATLWTKKSAQKGKSKSATNSHLRVAKLTKRFSSFWNAPKP